MAGCWGALGTAPGRDGKGAGWQKGKSRRRAGPRAPDGPSGGSGAGVVRRRFSCWILSHRPCVASRGHSRGLGSRAPSGRGPASQPWGTHPVHPHVYTPYLPVLTPDVNAPPRGMTAPRPRRRPWPRHALSTCPGQAVRPSLGGCMSRACAVTQVGRRIPWGASLGSDPQTPCLLPCPAREQGHPHVHCAAAWPCSGWRQRNVLAAWSACTAFFFNGECRLASRSLSIF